MRLIKSVLGSFFLAMSGLSVVLALLAGFIIEAASASISVFFLWLLFSASVFHFVLWVSRKEATLNQVRALEYLYITFGIIGLLGIVDVSDQLSETSLKLETQFSVIPPDRACISGDLSELKKQLSPLAYLICAIEKEELTLSQMYDHRRLRRSIDEMKKIQDSPEYSEHYSAIEWRITRLEDKWNEIDKKYYKSGRVIYKEDEFDLMLGKIGWLGFKVYGYLLLGVGLGIKLAKTTAEIKRWYLDASPAHPPPPLRRVREPDPLPIHRHLRV